MEGADEFFKKCLLFYCILFLNECSGQKRELKGAGWRAAAGKMGLLSVDLLITLQILPVFFSNCLFLALYDSVILLKHMVLLLSRSKAARGEWRRMLTSEGLRCVWNSFLLDAYKQVKLGGEAPNSNVIHVANGSGGSNSRKKSVGGKYGTKCHLLDFANSERPLVVNFGSAT